MELRLAPTREPQLPVAAGLDRGTEDGPEGGEGGGGGARAEPTGQVFGGVGGGEELRQSPDVVGHGQRRGIGSTHAGKRSGEDDRSAEVGGGGGGGGRRVVHRLCVLPEKWSRRLVGYRIDAESRCGIKRECGKV